MNFVKFHPCCDEFTLIDDDIKEDYDKAHKIGALRIGEICAFIRAGFKIYYIPYTGISRFFRRVQTVPIKMCCGKGDLKIEHIVFMSEDKEIIQVQMPGTKAAKIAMNELSALMPEIPNIVAKIQNLEESNQTKDTSNDA